MKRKKSNNGHIKTLASTLPDYPITIQGVEAENIEKMLLAFRMQAKGSSYSVIAKRLGIGKSTAHKYVAKCKEYFKTKAGEAYEERLAEVYGQIDVLLHECYAAFDRSVGTQEVITEKSKRVGDSNELVVETTRKVQESAGDPRFLQIAANLVSEKSKILSIEKDAETGKGLVTFLSDAFKNVQKERFLKYKPTELPQN